MIRYIRVERVSTGSWMTIRLPYEMCFDAADLWALNNLGFDWEVVGACIDNPDDEIENEVGMI